MYTLLLCLVMAASFLVGWSIKQAEVQVSEISGGLCFSIPQPDLPNSTPALWEERPLLKDMSHETRASLRCSILLEGRHYQADLNQILVQRPDMYISR